MMLWLLIFCVCLTGLKDAQIAGRALFWGVSWGCFPKRLAFELMSKDDDSDVDEHQSNCCVSKYNKKV